MLQYLCNVAKSAVFPHISRLNFLKVGAYEIGFIKPVSGVRSADFLMFDSVFSPNSNHPQNGNLMTGKLGLGF
jgi:hypothetical protein